MEQAPLLFKTHKSLDYTAMKFLSVCLILLFIINGTLAAYYFVDILVMGKGWAWIIDTFPMFLAAFGCGIILIYLYIHGLALSSISVVDSSLRLV